MCISVCIYIYIYIYTYRHMCVYIYIYIYMYIAMLVLLYGFTSYTLTKSFEKMLNRNYTRMLHTVLNKSWKQHSTKQQLYGHLPLISQTLITK